MILSLCILPLIISLTLGSPIIEKDNVLHPAYQKDIEISSSIDTKIVGGSNAIRHQFPYQVSLNWGVVGVFSHVCGGSILSPTTVLSAAHCIMSYGSFMVIGGILNRNEGTEFTQSRTVSRITNHPQFPGGAVVSPYDITIIRLVSPFTWTISVQPINLPNPEEVFLGTAVLSGWGRTSNILPGSANILQFAHKPLITNEKCANALISLIGEQGPLDSTMICSSGEHRVSACSGDSGGPLVQNNVLIGVVSWGLSPCGQQDAPTVYTRTASYINWINANQ